MKLNRIEQKKFGSGGVQLRFLIGTWFQFEIFIFYNFIGTLNLYLNYKK